MEPLHYNQLTAKQKDVLQFVAFKGIKFGRYNYYNYQYEKHTAKATGPEFDKAIELFEEKGWFTSFFRYGTKGEWTAEGKFLHPIIWLELLKTSKSCPFLKPSRRWGDYLNQAIRLLGYDEDSDYSSVVTDSLRYDGVQPLGSYLIWSFFKPGYSREWVEEFEYHSYDQANILFQLAYSVKRAAMTCFVYYKETEVDSFLKYTKELYDWDDSQVQEIEDCVKLGTDFINNGSAHDVLQECHEQTIATSWLLCAGLLRQKNYKKAFQYVRSATKQKAWCTGYRSALEDLIYGLCLYHNKESASAEKKINEYAESFPKFLVDEMGSIGTFVKENACTILLSRLCFNASSVNEFETIWENFVQDVQELDRRLFFGLLLAYLGASNALSDIEVMKEQLPVRSLLIESEIFAIKEKLGLIDPEKLSEEAIKELFLPIINDIVVKKDYEIAINQLNTLMKNIKPSTSRVVYLLDDDWGFSVRQQKYTRNGWGALNLLSFKAFTEGVPFMEDVDLQIANIANNPSLPHRNLEILKRLKGSDRVFSLKNPDTRINIEEVKFELATKTHPDQSYSFESNIPILAANLINEPPEVDGAWWSVGNTYYQRDKNTIRICTLTDDQKQMADILLKVSSYPSSVRKDLTEILESVSKTTTVMSDLLQDSKNLPVVKGLTQITVRIQPIEDTFDVRAYLYLAENEEYSHEPGVGLSSIAMMVNGKNVRIERDLQKEKENYNKFQKAVESLSEWQNEDGSWELELPQMLELLEAIRELGDAVRVEWPEGAELKVKRPVRNFNHFSLSLHGSDFWFSIGGQLQVDNNLSIKINTLLDKIRESKGRFIRLEGNEFLALNEKLIRQLKALEEISSKKGDGRTLSRYSVEFLKTLQNEGIEIDSDGQYEGLLERIDKASELVVKVPKTFKGQLRTYQKEGYEWMSRLAAWEAGGILADDMGLGKTVQAIALLGERKELGPSLVVCPSAVLINWKNELDRFDPSLNVRLFNKEDREAVLKEAKAGDVVLSTYGVLTQEIEKVCKVEWNVVILDEAHSIKNKATLVSKSVMQLKAKARFLMTGTPIQNHLGEIWNLFEFANPGLLGSFNSFMEKFIVPVEKNKDKERQALLRNIISPFILRRTKQEVEQELPPRTEVEMKIPLSDEEKALYKRLNEEAVADIMADTSNNGSLKILAHLTKLRKAACHPELVEAKMQIGSSKTDAFLVLVQRLISEGHRALVFSQFTSHLALIKRELKALKIPFLYMDGSNSPAERDRLKKQFQEGTTPLFLISLRAGGVGMNLTAADYVIHLDPWWNPAVEDQASDRAHRIGQTKPVHIYKLIAEGTIEEKILQIHRDKRTLADALLEGSDVSARFSKKEILDILKASATWR